MADLTEGIDYTIENGLYVFTREYLLSRGACCGSGCVHCPFEGRMRVISMVPSWTETLKACGANIVGRTRFCIHPKLDCEVVGGTKDWNPEAVSKLKPDLIVLDREENPEFMAIDKTLATHIHNVKDVAPAFRQMASAFQSLDPGVAARLLKLATRWDVVSEYRNEKLDWRVFPGVQKWLTAIPPEDHSEVVYVIWKNPWMAASAETFIGSMLELLGVKIFRSGEGRYPQFSMESLPDSTVLLYSTEPYPFLKKPPEPGALAAAIIDGESLSWFGIRSLVFLEKFFFNGANLRHS